VIVDDSAAGSNNLVAGANRSGYHFKNTNFARDYLGTVADIAAAREGDPCPECGAPLRAEKVIEVARLTRPGTERTEKQVCEYQDEQGGTQPMHMGVYALGIDRLLGCLAEEHHDERGLTLPPHIAPFQVHIVNLLKDSAEAEALCTELAHIGLDVLLDDRKDSAGVKFNDADLLGMPLRITIGKKAVRESQVEFRRRTAEKSRRISRNRAAEAAREELWGSSGSRT
jgi:prolyl-tRNA synthetase